MNHLSHKVIGASMKVHRTLGPGLLESAYNKCLHLELVRMGLNVRSEVPRPIIYEDIKLEYGYRIDLLVEDKLVLELKVVESLTNVHFAQVLTYLKLGNYPLGLLINFHTAVLKDGIRRIINTSPP